MLTGLYILAFGGTSRHGNGTRSAVVLSHVPGSVGQGTHEAAWLILGLEQAAQGTEFRAWQETK
ncbi:MAG: hypothetical protein BZY88_18935 [SAR202 cluster bacterium Io17-Chloro-G9]|nr:MAG: hypothetical protein BZY88_18935 [SAR202 cluster bacterium Io17-Chloro-G9]